MEYFLRGRFRQAHWFRARKTQFAGYSDWEKFAFAVSASCLPKDEYEKWVTSFKASLPGPFKDDLADWLKENWGQFETVLSNKTC